MRLALRDLEALPQHEKRDHVVASPGVDPLVGTTLDDRYRVLRLLGSGGMGAVYEGEQLRLSRKVAIKTIHPHLVTKASVVERFRREAMAAAAAGSKHIVEVHDLGQLPNGTPYMVMEFLDGIDVAARIGEARFSLDDAAEIVMQACDALGAAHDAGIVHRDVKSENIMLITRRGRPFVKVVDFGISKLRDSSLTGSAELLGTPYAMAPEQLHASKDVDARADIYSLGVVLYHMLAGSLPFDATTLPQLIAQIASGDVKPLRTVRTDLPEPAYAIVETTMARDPAGRFQSMQALERALGALNDSPRAPSPDMSSQAFAPTEEVAQTAPPGEPPVSSEKPLEPESAKESNTSVSGRVWDAYDASVSESLASGTETPSRVREIAFLVCLALALGAVWVYTSRAPESAAEDPEGREEPVRQAGPENSP